MSFPNIQHQNLDELSTWLASFEIENDDHLKDLDAVWKELVVSSWDEGRHMVMEYVGQNNHPRFFHVWKHMQKHCFQILQDPQKDLKDFDVFISAWIKNNKIFTARTKLFDDVFGFMSYSFNNHSNVTHAIHQLISHPIWKEQNIPRASAQLLVSLTPSAQENPKVQSVAEQYIQTMTPEEACLSVGDVSRRLTLSKHAPTVGGWRDVLPWWFEQLSTNKSPSWWREAQTCEEQLYPEHQVNSDWQVLLTKHHLSDHVSSPLAIQLPASPRKI